jgi:hypothetical protein
MSKWSIITKGDLMARDAIHPGEHLAEQLEALEMSAAELARKLKVPTSQSRISSMGSVRSPVIRPFAWAAFSARAPSSG